MSGSVTDSDACGTDWEKWIPQIDSAKGECNFSWRPPWKNFRIKLCSKDNKVLDNTSGYLVPLKMQFLMTHHLATIQKIIMNLESSTVESINATEELLEIKVKSLECEDIFTEIDRVLAREIDDIVMKPIQRLEFTSNLVEELFDQELKEKSIDLMRDEANIFIVGFEKMKSFITKNIDEINRVTVSKVVKLGDKWKIEAFRCFEIIETLSRTFTDVVVRLQEDSHCVYLKGRDVTISKAEKEVHKLFSDLFNEKLRVDPLILKLLICKEASDLFKEVLQKDNLQVVWTVDQSHLYFVSKTQIDTDALTAVVYKTFLTTGFCKSSQYKNQFCNSNVFTKITKQHTNKLLFLETTKTSVNIAGTKSLIFLLLHQEQIFYNKAGNTKEIQVDTLSYEVAGIKDEKMKVDLQMRELEVKLITETQKNKKANDQYLSLIRKCREEEEKFKRIIHEKELLLNESKDEKANFTKRLAENKTDTVDEVVQSIRIIKVSNIPVGCSEDCIRFFFENKRKSGGGEIQDLDYDEDSRTAIITFEEDDVAERVISRMPLLFEKKKIDVEIFVPDQPTPDVEDNDQASGNEETGHIPNEFVIEVRGMKPTTSKDTLRYYFECREVANADVVKMEYIEEKRMYMIWFEEESAVEAVMSKSLRVDGQTLNAKRYVPSPPPKPVPKYDNKVFITNISSTTTKDSLEIFLEAKSKGMPEEIIFGEAKGTALITFEQQPDMEKLQTACMKRQLDGSHLRIHTVPITDCIVVTGYKDNTSSDRIEYYFDNKRRSGVEGVREVKLVEDEGKLLVYFNDPESALEVCKREHKVEGQILNVHVYYECLGQASIDDEGLKFKSLKQTVIQNINPRTIEFLLNSDKNKAAFEKKLSRHYAVVEWPDSKDIEDKLDVNCTLTEEVKDCRKLAKTWAKTVKTEAEKFFSMLTVKEIQTLQKAWNVVMKHLKEISISNPESVAIRVIKEDCKIVIIGHKIPVEEVAEKVEIIMKDVAAEHDRRKLQVTEEVPLKHFQLLVLLYLHFLDKMKKEFEGLSVHVNMKKHIMIFTGMTSHVNAAKVKMFEQIQEITFVTAGKFSAGYIEFLKIPEVKSYVGQQIKQKGVLGIWNVKEGNVITMYSLSDENAVTACDVLKKSIIEAPISLDDKQSALIGYEVWNEEIKTVQMEYKKALVKIVVADSKTIVIYQTSAEDSAIVKEKVMDIFHRHRYASSRYRGRRN
ncbi:uncharacterized protein [Mytilus edulis]